MARFSARERAKLPDRAFAYIDSEGRRWLPINDEAHVRNALAASIGSGSRTTPPATEPAGGC